MKHNIRVVHMITGEYLICNITQIREENQFVGYQLLYPIRLIISDETDDVCQVSYRRWNPFTPYEDYKVAPGTVISAMLPDEQILKTYVTKLKEGGAETSFIPEELLA